ncbi:hypothetical protein [Microbulbifer epialgicus]|uniref:Uncharacterized protein n=1 Tax=Microbulbifer epialgicus TaxID=393907 RepID=A0ABV4P2M3_9GAMM
MAATASIHRRKKHTPGAHLQFFLKVRLSGIPVNSELADPVSDTDHYFQEAAVPLLNTDSQIGLYGFTPSAEAA